MQLYPPSKQSMNSSLIPVSFEDHQNGTVCFLFIKHAPHLILSHFSYFSFYSLFFFICGFSGPTCHCSFVQNMIQLKCSLSWNENKDLSRCALCMQTNYRRTLGRNKLFWCFSFHVVSLFLRDVQAITDSKWPTRR